MSKIRNARGRQPATPDTARGRSILAAIKGQGLTLHDAAERAGLSFPALYNAIHKPPEKQSVKVVAALCLGLGLPLRLVAPQLAHALDSSVA